MSCPLIGLVALELFNLELKTVCFHGSVYVSPPPMLSVDSGTFIATAVN